MLRLWCIAIWYSPLALIYIGACRWQSAKVIAAIRLAERDNDPYAWARAGSLHADLIEKFLRAKAYQQEVAALVRRQPR